MSEKNYDLICFGEILWDIFPDREVIGGAPLNLALRANSYGLKVGIISRLGLDDKASSALTYLRSMQMDDSMVQTDNDWPTGYVDISIDKDGSASYNIKKPAAWDYIKLTENNLEEVRTASVFVYGSLAARNEVSRRTLLRLLKEAKLKVLDINLRPPDYDTEILKELMTAADLIKLNDEELYEICEELSIDTSDTHKAMISLASKMKAESICVTSGSKGAILLYDKQFYEHPGYKVEVEDTVGSGDSFLATLITELLLQGKGPEEALKNAAAIGAIVASKKGANPVISISDIMTLTPNS